MASTPAFASVPRLGVAAVSTANTARDGTGTIVDILVGVAAGTRLDRVAVQSTGDPQDSTCTLFIHNGTSYFLFDEIDLGQPVAASATLPGVRWERAYYDLVLPTDSFKFAAAVTVALTSGVLNVFALGSDLT